MVVLSQDGDELSPERMKGIVGTLLGYANKRI